MYARTKILISKTLGKSSFGLWFRKSVWASIENGIFTGITLIVNILLARWLIPEEFGAFALTNTIFLFVSLFHASLITDPMSVLGPYDFEDDLDKYKELLIKLEIIISLVFIPIFLCSLAVLFTSHSDNSLIKSFVGISLSAPFMLFLLLLRRMSYLSFEPQHASLGGGFYSFFLIVFLYILFRIDKLSPLSSFIAIAICSTLSSFVIFYKLKINLTSNFSSIYSELKHILSSHWNFGKWIVASAPVMWLCLGAYDVIAASFIDLEAVAALRSIQKLTTPSYQICVALSALVIPKLSNRYKLGGILTLKKDVSKVNLTFFVVAFSYFIVFILFGPYLTEFLYKGKYDGYKYLIPFIMLVTTLESVKLSTIAGLRAMQENKSIFYTYSTLGLFGLLIGIPGTYFFGLMGNVVSRIIANLVTLVVTILLYRICLRKRISKELEIS